MASSLSLPADPSAGMAAHALLHVPSETSALRQVIVHTPGREMALVAPHLLDDLLFEDILHVEQAHKEHERMCAVFDRIIGRPGGVLQLSELLHDAFAEEEARHAFVDALGGLAPEQNLQAFAADLKRLSQDELFHFALTGQSPLSLLAFPVPNLMFTRDVSAVVGEHVVISHPATAARARESVIMRTVLRFHPAFAPHRERIITLPPGVTFEGGDLLVVRPDLILVGHSERTSFGGVMALTQSLFAQTDVEHVLMVDLPKARACMHLDTVFTFATPDECVVFPPIITEGAPNNVVHFTRGDAPGRFVSTLRPSVKEALETILGHALTFIPCGGNDHLKQRREQWTDGANFFALAPGVVVGYERNHGTFDMMAQHGYRVVSAHDLLLSPQHAYQPGEKLAIQLAGTELSRGRGGPRCMTMPLARRDGEG